MIVIGGKENYDRITVLQVAALDADPMGLRRYELSLNGAAPVAFLHERYKGLGGCLRRAAAVAPDATVAAGHYEIRIAGGLIDEFQMAKCTKLRDCLYAAADAADVAGGRAIYEKLQSIVTGKET